MRLTLAKLRNEKTYTFKLVITAILSVVAALFQSAGGLIPAVGMLISPLATLPIIIGMFTGIRYGLSSYVLTIFLILIIQPSERLCSLLPLDYWQ